MSATFQIIAGAIALTAITGIGGTTAHAQTQQQLNWCNGKDGAKPDSIINGCTAVIQSGKYAKNNLTIAFNLRGLAYYKKREYDAAIEDYNQAISLNPNFAEAFNNRGEAYLLKKDYKRAIAEYDQAIKLDATNWSSFNGRGGAFNHLQQYDQALRDYSEAVRLNPKHPWPWLNRCLVYVTLNQLAAALRDCNTSIVDLGYTVARENRAIVYLKLGRLDEAIADFNEVIREFGNDAEPLFGRGVAKRKMGNTAGADVDIMAAKSIQADIAEKYARWGIQ